MGSLITPIETRIARLIDEDNLVSAKWASLTEAIESREDKTMTEVENEHVMKYRDRLAEVRAEYAQLTEDVESAKVAEVNAKKIRQAMAGIEDGVEESGDGIVYRDFATYARDTILSRGSAECSKIAQLAGGNDASLKARERLELLKARVNNTLSSNVGGLQPPEHIAQIFQVIDASRPLVAAAPSTGLVRGTLTYPSVDTPPVVAVQASEKTAAGDTGMVVSMKNTTASTYLGGGDLSWQAINWSTPDALALWFQLAAADYALKTETDAATVVTDDAFTHIISSPLGGTPSFADFMTAIGAGYAKVFTNAKRIANTIIVAPDRFGYVIGMTSSAFAQFTNVSDTKIGPLNVIISRGLDAGTMIVGDMAGLLVAETAGAPVELRVVEPAIGGVEVGIIGAFEAVVVDPGAFSLITTAS